MGLILRPNLPTGRNFAGLIQGVNIRQGLQVRRAGVAALAGFQVPLVGRAVDTLAKVFGFHHDQAVAFQVGSGRQVAHGNQGFGQGAAVA